MKEKENTIAVDLDKTLAHYDGWKGPEHIGEPIQPMLNRVNDWISRGFTVKIFTARASEPVNIPYIEKWLEKHGIGGLEVTNKKTPDMIAIWDDRARQVVPNTGILVSEHPDTFLELLHPENSKERKTTFDLFISLEKDSEEE